MSKWRRCVSFLLAFCLTLGLLPAAAAAETRTGLENFTQRNTYAPGRFTDVAQDSWYHESVKAVYELGLMVGNDQDQFVPGGEITVAETVTIACRIHAIYRGAPLGDMAPGPGERWYQPYLDYAAENGLQTGGSAHEDYVSPAGRADFVRLLAGALPLEEYARINQVADNAIPDVKTTDPAAAEIYRFYRAGILTGFDEQGTFAPDSTIRRSEVAAILTRMVRPELRMSVTLEGGTGGTAAAAEPEYLFGTDIYTKKLDAAHIQTDTLTSSDGVKYEGKYVDNQLILVAKDGVTREQVEALVAPKSGTVVGQIPDVGYYQVEFNASYSADGLIQLASTLTGVQIEDAFLNQVFILADNQGPELDENAYYPNDPYWIMHDEPVSDEDNFADLWVTTPYHIYTWGLRACNVPRAWKLVRDATPSPSIRIGILDSAVDPTHPDLRIKNGVIPQSDATHGTGVAGIVGAITDNEYGMAGIAINAEILAVDRRSVRLTQETDNMNLAGGLAALIQLDCQIINMSVGAPRGDMSEDYREEVKAAADANESLFLRYIERGKRFLLVTSAGNNGEDDHDTNYNSLLTYYTNSKIKNRIIVVGGVERAGGEYARLAGSSHSGGRVDVMAPGFLYTLAPSNSYQLMSGTSAASPFVAGVAALVWEANPSLTPEEVKEIILDTADIPVRETEVNNTNPNMVNAEEAVKEALRRNGHLRVDVTFLFVDEATGERLTVDEVGIWIDDYTGSGTDRDWIGEIIYLGELENGMATEQLNYGTYTLTFTADGYQPSTGKVEIDDSYFGDGQRGFVVSMTPSDAADSAVRVRFVDAETEEKLPLRSLLDNYDNTAFTLRDGDGNDLLATVFSEVYDGKVANVSVEDEELVFYGLRAGSYQLEIYAEDETYVLNGKVVRIKVRGGGTYLVPLEKKMGASGGSSGSGGSDVEFPLIVGDVQVTEGNASDILGDGAASYDPNTCTLTLNSADISAKQPIYYTNSIPLTVVINGSVRLASTKVLGAVVYSEGSGLKIMGGSGSASLEIASDARTGGIYIDGGSSPSSLPSNVKYGIYSPEDISLLNLTLTLGYATYGVEAGREIYVENCAVGVGLYVPDTMFSGGSGGGGMSFFQTTVVNNTLNQWSAAIATSGAVQMKDSRFDLRYSAPADTRLISAGDLEISGGSLSISSYGGVSAALDLLTARNGISFYDVSIRTPSDGQVVNTGGSYTIRGSGGSCASTIEIS